VGVEPSGTGAGDERVDLPRDPDADRVREDDFRRVEAGRELGDCARVDAALEGTAEGDADRDRRRLLRLGEDPLDARGRLFERCVAVAPVELLRRAEGRVHPVEACLREALVPLLVEHEARVLGAVAALDPADDLLRARHLRHAVVAHEADRLDAWQSRGGEPVDELRARRRLQRLGLVLEAVARADVDDAYAR